MDIKKSLIIIIIIKPKQSIKFIQTFFEQVLYIFDSNSD